MLRIAIAMAMIVALAACGAGPDERVRKPKPGQPCGVGEAVVDAYPDEQSTPPPMVCARCEKKGWVVRGRAESGEWVCSPRCESDADCPIHGTCVEGWLARQCTAPTEPAIIEEPLQ